ncbi:HAMP domain-containing histidine kinase [Leucobacter allii]|uniref:histidine kinase n=1 Tax=Leucobacter allii TaxID=2932247 RepID=A0ABY4FGU5_9MICO|nr:HAMP domain-containing sensor histidine kinase [Leucobacter allii]UOQ55738.1 HAMP domain-containing histidine kinase [Leucobacter allii]
MPAVPRENPPRRRSSLSVRTRIVSVITLVSALGLLAVGLSVYVVERHRILDQIDQRLRANLESARYLVAEGSWSTSSAALAAVVERMSPDDNTGALGMTDGRITTVPGVELDVDLREAEDFAAHVERTRHVDGPTIGTFAEDGVVWRYLAAPIAIAGSEPPRVTTFVMVYDVEAELGEINTAARMFLIVSVIALGVIAGSGTIVATRLLRPLRVMRRTAERVSAQSLEERLPIVGTDDVAELATTMNEMLDRLDEALASQRRLLSDVGHELNTPLTIVRGHIELMDPEDPEDARGTRDLALDELQRMSQLVRDLSDSASLHGPSPVQPEPVDVADLLLQIGRKAAAIDGVRLHMGALANGVALLDPARITQAMLQLVQNAVTHGGGEVELGSAFIHGRLELTVRDHGPGVAEAQQARIFERFARGAGSEDRAGSGLGLSIVQVIARAHGGDAAVSDAAGGGARFVVSLPVSPRSE